MKTHTIDPESFEFYFPDRDTLISVENRTDGVVIHATRDTFSEERKVCFIRELAAEGFIPDDYQWINERSSFSAHSAVRWLVDYSWCTLSSAAVAGTHRFMIKVLVGGALLWLILMASLFLSPAQHSLSNASRPITVSSNHG